MSDDAEPAIFNQIRRDRSIAHDYLCKACAHRFHSDCEKFCEYCHTPCQCACGRWAVPLSAVEKT